MAPYAQLLVRVTVASDETTNILMKVMITLQMLGLVGCFVTLATALFSPHVQRHPTWLSFMFTWGASAVAYLLLFMTGQLDNPDPPFGICFAQASLIYSIPILTAASTLALVAQVHTNVRSMFSDQLRLKERIFHVVLLFLPYILFAGMTIACVILGLNDHTIVHRGSLATPYCNLKNRIPSKIASISVAVMLFPALFLEALICRILWKNWAILRGRKSSLSTALRVTCFSLLGMLSIALSLVFASTSDRDPEMNVIISILPAAAFLLFGTQWDIVRAWMFWKKPEPLRSTNKFSVTSETEPMHGRPRNSFVP